VKDNNGNTVAVVAQDLVKGQTTASFDFVTALTVDPTGVWTVNGKTFDFGAIEKLNNILTAAASLNEINTLAALKAAGLTDIKDENISGYVTEINAATAKDNLADIQAIITKVNTDSISSGDAAAAVKAVNDATNQPQLLAALQNKAFARVNADWIVQYQTDINTAKATPANTDTVAEIQAIVDGVNSAKIAAANTAAATSADQNAVTALIQTYVVADATTPGAPTPKADAIKASQIKAGVFKVKEASTQTSVYSALSALAALDSTNLPVAELNSFLKAEYLASQAAYKASINGSTSVADIKTNIVDDAAADALAASLLGVDALTGTSTTAQVKAALQKLANVTSHEAVAADKFDFSTVKDANLLAYVTTASTGFAANTPNTLTTVKAAISAVNGTSDQQAYVDTIASTSSTAAQVKDALTELAAANTNNTTTLYLNASSQVKLEVAQFIIDNRASLENPLTVATIVADGSTGYGTNAIGKALADHATKVGEFNAIGDLAAASNSSVKAALDTYNYAPYAALSTTKKVAVAEQIKGLTKDVSGTATPLNFGGADAVTTLKKANEYIDAAIAAVQ